MGGNEAQKKALASNSERLLCGGFVVLIQAIQGLGHSLFEEFERHPGAVL